MIVYKFGGASIADASRIKNVSEIILKQKDTRLVVVISAMGKTTNALEGVWNSREDIKAFVKEINAIKSHHIELTQELGIKSKSLSERIAALCNMEHLDLSADKHYLYDQIVSVGELLSTTIITEYLASRGSKSGWLDAREVVHTDDNYRDAKVDWSGTESSIKTAVAEDLRDVEVIVSQGFIGHNANGDTTTLGREGSDFSAAIFAYCLEAESMTIWKDVKGILTADPRKFENVVKIDRLSYRESLEMTYYGAKVIHPKTIKPLQKKEIPLYVKSFLNPNLSGTLIGGDINVAYPPIVVVEENQALVHFTSKDFSFINEDHLTQLFAKLSEKRVKVNLIKNSASCFTICADNVEDRIETLVKNLEEAYQITVDADLELITIRHFNKEIVDSLKSGKAVLMEERAPATIQMVLKEAPLMKRK